MNNIPQYFKSMVTQTQPLPLDWYFIYDITVCIGFFFLLVYLIYMDKKELRHFQQQVEMGDKVKYAYRYYREGKERKCYKRGTISTTQTNLVSLRDDLNGIVRYVDRKDLKPVK